ncbi:MAG TPA: NAD(P)H-quinone oxidoreductase, partial [Gemmatimonadaceae bacterium]
MKAAVITRFGGPEVLELHDRPTPVPGRGEVLVRVHASALNRADLHQREGNYPAPPGAPQDIPGLEFAGEIAGLGDDVSSWSVGDRVFGIVPGGANAEYLVTDAGTIAAIPDTLSWTDAAAVPEAFITAHDAMVTQAQVRAGESVLIHAVGSGVGLAATQLARAWQATPFGTARSEWKIDRARQFGLADGAVAGEDPQTIVETTAQWTNGKGIDVTLDLIGGPYVAANIRAAALHGRIILIGTLGGRSVSVPIGMILGKRLTLRGTVLRARPIAEKRVVSSVFAREVVPLFASGVLRPNVDTVLGLAQIAEAHARMASNTT